MSELLFYSPNRLPEDSCYWQVILKDGTVLCQDDNVKPKDGRESSWVRLGKYLKEHKLRIDRMSFHFRTNSWDLPYSKNGYYYSNGVSQSILFAKKGINYHVGGVVLDDLKNVEIYWIKIPELIVINKFMRPIEKCKFPMLLTYSW